MRAGHQRQAAHLQGTVAQRNPSGPDLLRALDVDVVLVRRRGGSGVVGGDVPSDIVGTVAIRNPSTIGTANGVVVEWLDQY